MVIWNSNRISFYHPHIQQFFGVRGRGVGFVFHILTVRVSMLVILWLTCVWTQRLTIRCKLENDRASYLLSLILNNLILCNRRCFVSSLLITLICLSGESLSLYLTREASMELKSFTGEWGRQINSSIGLATESFSVLGECGVINDIHLGPAQPHPAQSLMAFQFSPIDKSNK